MEGILHSFKTIIVAENDPNWIDSVLQGISAHS